MSSPQHVYLAREGKTFGPFSPDEIKKLKSSGEFYEYEWFFDGTSTQWQRVPSVAPPPPPPPSGSGSHAPAPAAVQSEKAEQKKSAPSSQNAGVVFQAICHDFKNFLSGTASHVTHKGCEFVTDDQGLPAIFGAQSKLRVDLLDEKTDRSVTVSAQITQCTRRGSSWVYLIQWDHCPLLA